MSIESSQSLLTVRLLGEFSVIYQGRPLAGLAGDRPQSLLAYLLLHSPAPQSRRHLSYLLWPDSSDAQARGNLRNLLFTVRQALPAGEWLATDAATIQWRPDAPLALDVAAFRRQVAAARRHTEAGEEGAGIRALEEAIALYGGDLLPGNYDDWLLALREELRQEFAEALRHLAARHIARKDYGAALRPAQRYLQLDPLNEAAYIELMHLHALLGDRCGSAAALSELRRPAAPRTGCRAGPGHAGRVSRDAAAGAGDCAACSGPCSGPGSGR